MTREEAERRAAEFSREHPERARYHWLAREGAGGWHVARVPAVGALRIDPLREGVLSRPKPPDADDPRTAFERNVGGPYSGA